MAFQIPDPFLAKLKDLSGTENAYKGFLLFVLDEEKNPRPVLMVDDTATMLALKFAAQKWLDEHNEQQMFMSGGNDEESD